MTVPAAFTRETGRDHWHALLRARAIENQAYVLAPNQWGTHLPGRHSFGHSSVYDPWGKRIACASDGIGLVTADLDYELVRDVRRKIPCGNHCRPELFLTGAESDPREEL